MVDGPRVSAHAATPLRVGMRDDMASEDAPGRAKYLVMLVPTLCVGTLFTTLCVIRCAESRAARMTQRAADSVPTPSVATRLASRWRFK
jgi:hypothetical protein